MKSTFASLPLLASAALAASRTSAPDGCLTVSANGDGDHSTIQAAVDALPEDSAEVQCIFIQPGTYNEQVLVTERSAPQFNVYGYTEDDTSFVGNQATIVFGLSQADGLSNDETATLRVKANGFRLYNVNVENSYGEGSQAVAVSAYADSGYYGSSFVGFQDTLLSNEGNQVYVDTQIVGATDFIFGQRAASWFERADIRVVAKSIGYVTGTGADGSSYYVFDHSTISAADGDSVPDGAYYLGRPWRSYARVVFQNTDMSPVINSAGWRVWNEDEPNTENVFYGEYANTGEGSEGTRAAFATALDAPIDITEILGGGYEGETYFDASYFAGGGADAGESLAAWQRYFSTESY